LHEQKQWFRAGIAPGRVDVDRLLTTNRYELVVQAEINVVLQHEQTLAEEIERRRQTLVAADREVRVLEKLRERQLEQFRQQQALAEMKQIDEVAARSALHEEPR
jgi:flagellar export protein FliJ